MKKTTRSALIFVVFVTGIFAFFAKPTVPSRAFVGYHRAATLNVLTESKKSIRQGGSSSGSSSRSYSGGGSSYGK